MQRESQLTSLVLRIAYTSFGHPRLYERVHDELGFFEDKPWARGRARDRPIHPGLGLGRSTLRARQLWSPTVVEAVSPVEGRGLPSAPLNEHFCLLLRHRVAPSPVFAFLALRV